MALQDTGRVFGAGEANTMYVSIPSAVATDSSFPFEEDETVAIRIEDDRLQIIPTGEESEG